MVGMPKTNLCLLVAFGALLIAEARTWRTPHSLSKVNRNTGTSFLPFVRGGDGLNNIPIVPDSEDETSKDSNLNQGVVRGGSTSTRKLRPSVHSSGLSVRPHGAISSSSNSIAPTITTSVSELPKANETASESLKTPAPKLKGEKEPSSHKRIAKLLKNRNARNLRRKVMHASFGFFFAALNHLIPKAKFVPGMAILTSATLIMELLRYRKGFGWMNDTLHLVLGKSLRKHEMDGKFTGSFYYFLGVTLTSALYPTTCATLGICQLAIADPTASFFGRATRHVYWSRIENGLGGFGRNKGILGFLGGALACVPMNYRLLSLAKFGIQPTQKALWTASFALGLAGAFADLAVPTPALTLPKKVLGVRVPPFHVDDNVIVPVFSAFACQYVFRYLNFPADLALSKFVVI